MNNVNFHIHTTSSDGLDTPKEIMEKIMFHKIKTISITDHDSIDNVDECITLGKQKNVQVVQGVELTANYLNGTCHILGYGVDLKYVNEFCKKIKHNRIDKAEKMIQLVNQVGYNVDAKEVLDITPNGVIGRRNIAKILKEKGYFSDEEEAIIKLFNKDKPCYVATKKNSIEDCINTIHYNNGISVIAHPWTLNLTLVELKKFIIKHKLQGIEVFNHNISRENCNMLKKIAEELDLYITCGTDYHGHKGLNELVVSEEVDCSKILSKLRR